MDSVVSGIGHVLGAPQISTGPAVGAHHSGYFRVGRGPILLKNARLQGQMGLWAPGGEIRPKLSGVGPASQIAIGLADPAGPALVIPYRAPG